jgi:DNA polymerase
MLREECIKRGLTPPNSFAQDDPEADKFFDDHAKDHPWIQGVRDYRKAGKHLKTLETMRKRMREDGWMSYGLKYGGAHTLRDSGDSGLNMQNLPKGLVCGVDVRAKIKAPEGYTLAIVDLSQIEPRCLHWLAGDEATLQYIREIPDLYEAQARAWGIYSGEGSMAKNAPDTRFLMKQLALGLGYGMGAKRFADVARMSPEEAERLTGLYRAKNPLVLKLWKKLETAMSDTARHPTNKLLEVHLPSGRTMSYRNVARMVGEAPKASKLSTYQKETAARPKVGLRAEIPRAGKFMRMGFWGGVLVENLVQSTARDIFMTQSLAIEQAGIPVIMRVHDEVVCLVREEEAEAKLAQIISIMSTPPEWAHGLPLSAEGSLSKTYKK